MQKGFAGILILVGILTAILVGYILLIGFPEKTHLGAVLSCHGIPFNGQCFGYKSVFMYVDGPTARPETPRPTPDESPAPTGVGETATPDSIMVNWKTYTDSKNIFSFQYPIERTIQVTDLGVIIVKPVNVPTEQPNSPTDGPGSNSIISLYGGSLNGKILKDLVIEEYEKDKSGANNDKEVSSIILNKLSGYEYTIGGFRQQRVIYLKNKDDNFFVIMTSISPDEIAQKILSTFKFLDQSPQSYTCPKNGWVNCMPIVTDGRQGSCAKEAVSWYKTNCPDFKGVAQ